jgi:glycerate 2-kinase
MREHALQIFTEAVKAVQPQYLLPRHIQRNGEELRLGDQYFARGSFNKVYVVGAGKASAAMARQVEIILGDLISEGVIVTKYDHGFPLQKIRCIEAGHPVPDEKSVQAGKEIVQLLKSAGERDLVIALISGGASALMVDYPPGSSLEELQKLFTRLLHSGADITEMNTVRKHLSPLIKGGQLVRAAHPASLVSFILSDVIGDPLESIASGPTVADTSTFKDAWNVLEKYRLVHHLSAAIHEWLQQGMNGTVTETPKPGDAIFNSTHNFLIGTNRVALEAAAKTATSLYYHTSIITDKLSGEASEQAAALIQQVTDYNGPRPACLLLGGETTVTIKANGKGGRNQEFVLAALNSLQQASIPAENMPVILSAGTDGTDGPTNAAGAVIDKDVATAAQKLQLRAVDYLKKNDSYHFFQQAGGHIITGPTQTNVMDIVVILIS